MKMSTKRNTNRTGIYVQKSVGVTTAGDGLAPQGDKSPVATKNIKSDEDEMDCEVSESKEEQENLRIKRMYNKFLKLGFSEKELKIMLNSLKDEHKRRYKTNKSFELLEDKEDMDTERRSKITQKNISLRTTFYHDQCFSSPAVLAGGHTQDATGQSNKEDVSIIVHKYLSECKRKRPQRKNSNKFIYKRLLKNYFANLNIVYPYKVQLVDHSNPLGQIKTEYQSILLDALDMLVQDERAAGKDFIQIGACEFTRKILHLYCANQETVKFLEYRRSFLNRLWQGADLFVTTDYVIPKRHKIKIQIPNFNLTSEEVLQVIKKQNNYPTEFWEVLFKTDNPHSFSAIVGVDPGSYERLKATSGLVYFFFDRIGLNLSLKRIVDDDE